MNMCARSPLPPLPLRFSAGGWGWGVERLNLLPNFQKGGAWQDLNLERGVAKKEGGNFFRGGWLQFYEKNKLKSEIYFSLS